MTMMSRRNFVTATGSTLLSSPLLAGDWNQWRGPLRNGSADNGFAWPATLDDHSLQLVWETGLGPSYSGPVVMDGAVFVTETVDRKYERVTSYDMESGKQRWVADWPGAMRVPMFAMSNGSWIRSTPSVTSGYLLVAGMRDVLVCLDPQSGTEIWRSDFVDRLNSKLPAFGFVSSPLIDGEHVYVQAGGGLLKLELATGELVWRGLEDGGGMYGSAFSSPVIYDVLGQRQLLVQTRKNLAGVSTETGKELWSVEVPSFRGMNILPPTVYRDIAFTSTYRNGSFAYQISRTQDQFSVREKWKNNVQGYMSSPLVFGDHVYLHLSNGRLTCMNLDTGEQKWSSRPFGKYWSSISQGNRMLALDERGDLLLIDPNPEKFDLAGKQKVASNAWAHLAIVNDLIFVRDLEKLMVYRWAA